MWRISLAVLALLVVGSPLALTLEAQGLKVGSISLELGMTPEEVSKSLPEGYTFGWYRDAFADDARIVEQSPRATVYRGTVEREGKRVRVTYREGHGEHGFISLVDDPRLRIVGLTFEDGRLSRATTLVGDADPGDEPSTDLAKALAETLGRWRAESELDISVEIDDLGSGEAWLRQVTFSQGNRQLLLVSTARRTQLVENLGRGDIPVVTAEVARD